MIVGLWRRLGRVPLLATSGLGLLMLGELMVPPMSITTHRALRFYSIDRAGFFHRRRIVGARFLSRLPSRYPRFGLAAMTGAAMATGCDCCLVTMGITGTLHTFLPAQSWLPHTFTVYGVAATSW